jgi:putative component of membrane protein insertase Oxa1/YidC/SpoIIIJ protein YidD
VANTVSGHQVLFQMLPARQCRFDAVCPDDALFLIATFGLTKVGACILSRKMSAFSTFKAYAMYLH